MMNKEEIINLRTIEPGILHINLNRPQQLNALSRDVLEGLYQSFQKAKNDKAVKAILLTGEGKAFCAGADIKQLAALHSSEAIAFARLGQSVFRELEIMGKPSIAAIQGVAFGGGCELAMSATLRIAANNAAFAQPEIKLGVIPGFGGTQRLPRLIGKGRALEMCLTGRRFSAEEAFKWGLVNELTTPEELLPRATTLLKEIVELAPIALKSIITSINQGYNMPLEDALELEAAHFGLCSTTNDKQEGVKAFLEKRKPVFSGA